jgi:hypothetical protein
LSASQWQEVFRHRHILQRSNVEHSDSKFDRQALRKLGSLSATRNIQGVYQLSQRLKIADIGMNEKLILTSL